MISQCVVPQKNCDTPRSQCSPGGEATGEIPAAERRKRRLQRHRGPSATAAVGPLAAWAENMGMGQYL